MSFYFYKNEHMEKIPNLAVILIVITIPLTGAIVQYGNSSRQTAALIHQEKMTTRRELMGMAIGILKERPPRDKEGQRQEFNDGEQGLRRWAVDVLNQYVNYEPKISPQNAENLIQGKSSLNYSYNDGWDSIPYNDGWDSIPYNGGWDSRPYFGSYDPQKSYYGSYAPQKSYYGSYVPQKSYYGSYAPHKNKSEVETPASRSKTHSSESPSHQPTQK